MSQIQQIDDETLIKWYAENRFNQDYLLIDIREVEEFQEEHIENSYNIPTMAVPKTDFSEVTDKTAVFLCRSGNRTRVYEHILLATGFKQMYCIEWRNPSMETMWPSYNKIGRV